MKVPLHIVKARRQQLAAWMLQQGHVGLQEICARFQISEATARRDLAALESEDQIVRTYGGALAEYNHRFASFRERLKNDAEAKRRIAAKAYAWIRPHMTIFLDAGTTIYALAEELQRHPVIPLEVVTNSLPVVDILAAVPEVRVHLLGGELLPRQSVLLGKAARKALDFYKIDVAFLGTQGANAKGLWNSQEEIVSFQKRMIESAKTVVFCLDASKLDKAAPAFLTGWNRSIILATNATEKRLAASGIQPASIQLA